MTASQGPAELRLRPHHIMCEPFMVLETFDRGEAFNALATQIKEALESQTDTLIEVIEGRMTSARSALSARMPAARVRTGTRPPSGSGMPSFCRGLEIILRRPADRRTPHGTDQAEGPSAAVPHQVPVEERLPRDVVAVNANSTP